MSRIQNAINNYFNFCPFLFISIILILSGFFLIFDSIIYVSSFKENSNVQVISKIAPKFHYREDLSIGSIKGNNDNKINQISNKLIHLNNYKEEVVLNDEMLILDLTTISKKIRSPINNNTKKEKFIISILPFVVSQNEKIRENRKKLLKIKQSLNLYKTLNKPDQQLINTLTVQYSINTNNKHKIDIIETLLESVDEIPNSIVLAQAANESGWGTSRFAREYNAFFGEYTFNTENGVVPIYRAEGEKHLIKFFSNINESVGSYFKNLNTHPAYKDFRENRKRLREKNLPLNPMFLILDLKPYAKNKNYIKIIDSIIKKNNLIQFDNVKIITTKS